MNTISYSRPWNYFFHILHLVSFVFVSCEEITNEMYSDLTMVIPEETADFKVQATACETKTIVTIDKVEFSDRLDPLNIQVEEVRFYINDDLLGTCAEAPYSFEGLIDKLPAGEHHVRMEYDLSGEGFLPGTGCTRQVLEVDSIPSSYISTKALKMDGCSYLYVDTLSFSYHLDLLELTPKNIRFYIDDHLVGTDDTAPYSFDGFVDPLSNGEHHLTIRYDVETASGLSTPMTMGRTFETDTISGPFVNIRAVQFDDKSYLETDSIKVPFVMGTVPLSVERIQLSVNESPVATHLAVDSRFHSFIDLLREGDNVLQIRYDVRTVSGDTTSVTLPDSFKVYPNIYSLIDKALQFDDKTYLKVNDVSLPYDLKRSSLDVQEMRFYIDDVMVGKDTELPFSFDAFIDKIQGDTHTLKVVYDVLDEDGTSGSYSYSESLSIMDNDNYVRMEKPTSENSYTFKVTELSFDWKIFNCLLEIGEVRYYMDGVPVGTRDTPPYLLEIENAFLSPGNHSLRMEYEVKDLNGVTVTCQETSSFYISEE